MLIKQITTKLTRLWTDFIEIMKNENEMIISRDQTDSTIIHTETISPKRLIEIIKKDTDILDIIIQHKTENDILCDALQYFITYKIEN